MKDFEPLMKLIINSKSSKRDMNKINNMILNDIRKEIQRAMDLYLLERCFAQINQE